MLKKTAIAVAAICLLVSAAFAQNCEPCDCDADNRGFGRGGFTLGERWATWGINLAIPGLGSGIVMDDWQGAGVMFAGRVGGIAATMAGYEAHGFYPMIGSGIYSIIRSATYLPPDDRKKKIFGGERAAAFGLNLIFPGLGSSTYMDDYTGADIMFFNSMTGLSLLMSEKSENRGWGYLLFYGNTVFNFMRTMTYKMERYSQYSTAERWATFGINVFIPGLGSAVIMRDWWGTGVQAGVTGLALYSAYEGGMGGAMLMIGLMSGNFVFNVIRSATYRRWPTRHYAHDGNDGIQLGVLPTANGDALQPYLTYLIEF